VRYLGAFFAHPQPGVIDHARIREPFLLRLLGEIGSDEGFVELGCHPGRVTDELHSSYAGEREIELATLTGPDLAARIEALGLTLASYHDWRR
jgi:predicted glycoside hydrolase/deacetylase ChbG (UPF0249 family)